MTLPLDILPEVADALKASRPIVALESSVIAQGLPWPVNLEMSREAEAAIREEGAVPAPIAVFEGRIKVGLAAEQIAILADRRDVMKASSRDLAFAVSQRRTAATTVAATMFIAQRAGIRILATGGIGGVHRGASQTLDVSADLFELGRTPVCVVCAGAKSVVDIPATLEALETLSVPVIGYGTEDFPAFYVQTSGERLEARVDSPADAARLLKSHWQLGGAGVVLAQPPPSDIALRAEEFEAAFRRADEDARAKQVKGKSLTPFLLSRLAEHTGGKTLAVNRALLVANARLAARVAFSLGNDDLATRTQSGG